jgi:hypothetical protein
MKMKLSFLAWASVFSFLTAESQTTIILQPGPEGKDAQITSLTPDTNRGDTESLKCMAWTHSGQPGTHRGLMDFDLSSVPSNAMILQASLNLYFATFEPNYVPHSGDNMSYLARITERWDESEVTWNSQPAITMDDVVVLPQSTYPEQDYTDIDVTEQIRMMKDDPDHNCGWMLLLDDETPYNCLLFASSDDEVPAIRPKLVVTYIVCDPLTVDIEYERNDQIISFTGISPTALKWFWDFGDGNMSVLQNPVHYYSEKGIYQVCLTVEDSCGLKELCDSIRVCDIPTAGFIYTSDGLTFNFQDTSHWAYGFDWDFGDLYYAAVPSPTHTYYSPGYFTVCQRVWNECAADTVCKTVYADYSGMKEMEHASLSVYPNPATDKVFINSSLSGLISVSLYDLEGKEWIIKTVHARKNEAIQVPLDLFGPGLYILRISSNEKTIRSKVIVTK